MKRATGNLDGKDVEDCGKDYGKTATVHQEFTT